MTEKLEKTGIAITTRSRNDRKSRIDEMNAVIAAPTNIVTNDIDDLKQKRREINVWIAALIC